jgi:hypothetical protein
VVTKGEEEMKSWWKRGLLLLVIVFPVGVWTPVSAWSTANAVVQTNEVAAGDRWMWGQIVQNEGTIRGDMISWAQNISSTGTVEGDIIAAGQSVNLTGKVLGNVRAAGATIVLANRTEKNVSAFGGLISLTQGSVVNGSLLALGRTVKIDGKIRGRTIIGGASIALGGEFFGDVEVNNFGRGRSRIDGHRREATLTVLPGAVIHGTLTFRGSQADIQTGAQIANLQWIKADAGAPDQQKQHFYRYGWKTLRLLFTTAAWFLLGLLLFRLFPTFFNRTAEAATLQPWNVIGHGLVGVFSSIVAVIICVVLLLLSLIMSPVFGIVSGVSAVAFYVALSSLAIIPASLWLGTVMLRRKPFAYRLGAGLIVINVGLFVFTLLAKTTALGPVFTVLMVLTRLGVVLLGGGALLYAGRQAFRAAKRKEDF